MTLSLTSWYFLQNTYNIWPVKINMKHIQTLFSRYLFNNYVNIKQIRSELHLHTLKCFRVCMYGRMCARSDLHMG